MLLDRGAEIPDYDAVRTDHFLYAEYGTGEHELYDLRTDPDEVHNLAGTHPALERELAHRIALLRRCGGSGCRRVENRSVEPADPRTVSWVLRPGRHMFGPGGRMRRCCYDALPQVSPSPHRLVA